MKKAYTVFALYTVAGIIVLGAAVTLAMLYDAGYRLDGLSVSRTGTVRVHVDQPGTSVFIDNRLVHTTSSDFEVVTIPNVNTGSQLVTVIQNAFSPWARFIDVPLDSTLDLYPFVLPRQAQGEEFTPGTREYAQNWRNIYGNTNRLSTTATTTDYIIEAQENSLVISCRNDAECDVAPIETETPVTAVYQFKDNPNAVVYSTKERLTVSEIDSDTERITHTLFGGSNIRFFPEDDTQYIVADGQLILRLSLEPAVVPAQEE